jgi:hypothetical protein
MIKWFQNRFSERSTYMALFGIATAFGLGDFSPEQMSAITTFMVILVATPDKKG